MILFRADGNLKIGIGHVMRCLSIADAFRRAGEECIFVLADISMRELIAARKYSMFILDSNYQRLNDEIKELKIIITKTKPDMVIVDSYFVSKSYLECLRRMVRLIYIDDLAAFAYPVDILINYNAYALELNYKSMYLKESIPYPSVLMGVKYAPLRADFEDVPKKKQNKVCRKILISTGGSDLIHLAVEFTRYIKSNKDAREYHLLLGVLNPDKEEVYRLAENIPNLRIHTNVSDMKSLIYSCDMAVSAAGSTIYEICACGTPVITYVLADNQIPGAEAFDRMGMALLCGDLREEEDVGRKVYDYIEKLSNDYKLRVKIGEKMYEFVDGHGADRIVGELILND